MKTQQSVIDLIGTIAKYVLIVVLILFFVRTAKSAYSTGYSVFAQEAKAMPGEGTTVSVEVTPDMSVSQIGKLLEKEDLIENGSVFQWQERFSSYHGELVPGTYELSSEMTPDEMMAVMAANFDKDGDGVGDQDQESAAQEKSEEAASEATTADELAAGADAAIVGEVAGGEATTGEVQDGQ